MPNYTENRDGITFLTSDLTAEEMRKVCALVNSANKIIDDYFGIKTSFDIIICKGGWEMEVQVISRRKNHKLSNGGNSRSGNGSYLRGYDETKSVGITDYRLQEIVIRCDTAKFGHYLHELIHGIISKDHPQQLREGLAWYFTLKLTDPYRYVRPSYPSWVDNLYVYPTKKLAQIVGDDFMKDIALGKAFVQEYALPKDVQELFLPEELFYARNRFHR